MAADAERLVDVRGRLAAAGAGRPSSQRGSGLLVTDDLVLTAAHVVFDGDRPLPVRLDFPQHQRSGTGTVVWPRERTQVDVALVRVDGDPPLVSGRAPQWGRFTGRDPRQPVDATGFPRVLNEDASRIPFQLSGHVNPQAGLREDRRYLVSVNEPPTARPTEVSPWAGMSGAALMSGGTVVGVVVIDTPDFDRDLLTVVPAEAIAADPQARELLGLHGPLGSVELDRVLSRPTVARGPLSPAQLLRADERVVDFQGRDDLLGDLEQWCRGAGAFDARLVVGPGGRGKTRLAHQLVRCMQAAGDRRWLSGLLATRTTTEELALVARTAQHHAVLLIADYAESRVQQLELLLDDLGRADSPPTVRLLMLARDRGEWWTALCDRHRELDRNAVIALDALHRPPDRDTAFATSLRQFATRLSDTDPEAGWGQAADRVEAPDLTEVRFGDALNLQMAALNALLAQMGEAAGGDTLEDTLLGHERQYWRSTLDFQGLQLSVRERDQAVAAATLIAARTRPEALTLLQRLPELSQHGRVAEWLRSLYPAETSARYWGALQPDRIGEHLVGTVAEEDPDLLPHVLGSEDVDELQEAVIILGRAMTHQPHLADQLLALAEANRPELKQAIGLAARRVADALPLQRMLQPPGPPLTAPIPHPRPPSWPQTMVDPEAYGDLPSQWSRASSPAEKLHDIGRGTGENPFTSSNPYHEDLDPDALHESESEGVGRGRERERRGTEAYEQGRLVQAEQEFRAAAAEYGAPGLPPAHRARAWLGHALVLNDLRRPDQALVVVDGAVSTIRSLVGTDMGDDVLGRALDLQASLFAEAGVPENALTSEYEAVSILRGVAEKAIEPDARRDLAKALSNLAGLLQRSGRVNEALDAAGEAQAMLAELSAVGELASSDDTFGRALLAYARVLAVLDDRDKALDLAAQAYAEFERISVLEPAMRHATDPGMAAVAEFRCGVLAESGHLEEAIASGEHAVALYADLADLRVGFQLDHARALATLAGVRGLSDDHAGALRDGQGALRILEDIAPEAAREGPSAQRRRDRVVEGAREVVRRAQAAVFDDS